MLTFNFTIFVKLSPHLGPGEYGLSKDPDVTLWMESRNYANKPPLRETCNFVIINSSLHDEFDEFKRNNTLHDYSILPMNELLEYWNTLIKKPSLPVLSLYGGQHLQLHCTEVDSLCEWVINKKKERVS